MRKARKPPEPPTPAYIYLAPKPEVNGTATASLILGIIGFFLMGIPLVGFIIGGIPDILAVILGIVGLASQIPTGKSAATAGIVLGGISLLSVSVGAGWIW